MEALTLEEVIALEAAANVVAASGQVHEDVHGPLETARRKLDTERAFLQLAAREAAQDIEEPGGRVA